MLNLPVLTQLSHHHLLLIDIKTALLDILNIESQILGCNGSFLSGVVLRGLRTGDDSWYNLDALLKSFLDLYIDIIDPEPYLLSFRPEELRSHISGHLVHIDGVHEGFHLDALHLLNNLNIFDAIAL